MKPLSSEQINSYLKADKFPANSNFENLDLSDFDFSGINLDGANFQNTKLIRTKFNNSSLVGANFTTANFFKCSCIRANLSNATLDQATIALTIFQEAILVNTSFSECTIEDVIFQESNIFESDFEKSSIKGAFFRRSKLLSLNLHETQIELCNFDSVVIDQKTASQIPPELKKMFKHTWDIRDENSEPIHPEQIVRTIELQSEIHQSVMDMMSYFGKILRDKFPPDSYSFKIEQDGFTATLVIDTKEEYKNEIETTFRNYGNVLIGKMPPEDFAANPQQLQEIKSLLQSIYKNQLQGQNKILNQIENLATQHAQSALPSYEDIAHQILVPTDTPKYILKIFNKSPRKLPLPEVMNLRESYSIEKGILFVDDERKQVFYNGEEIKEFQGRYLDMLILLLSSDGSAGSKERIYGRVWRTDSDVADIEEINSNVDPFLSKFRKILKDNKISALHRRGDGDSWLGHNYLLDPIPDYRLLSVLSRDKPEESFGK